MSHSTKFTIVKRGSLLLACLAVVLAAGTYVQTVVRIDPFAGMKATSKGVDPNLGVRVEGATIQSYDKGKLVAKAKVDRVDVRQDKQQFDLFGIREGTFYSEKGALSFEGSKAKWTVPSRQLDALNGAHIRDKNVDLNVPQFVFHANKGDVNIPGRVTGKMYDGKVKALGVKYNVNSGLVKTGPMEWQGKVAVSFQDGEKPQGRQWNIEGDDFESDGDVQTCTNGIADDGDIIVMADKIARNRKTDIVTATGHVKYFSTKVIMACEKAVIERKAKKATLTGNVQMLMKAKEKQDTVSREEGIPPYRPIVPEEIAKARPKADTSGQTEAQKALDEEIRSGRNMHDYPTVCYADKVVYWYKQKERHAEITGNPQARQEMRDGAWRQVWTHEAFYDGEKETLKMVSTAGQMDTRMLNSIGDDMVTTWIQFSTKEGEEERYSGGKMKGTYMDFSDEIPPADKAKPKTGGTTTGGTGGTTGGGQKPPPPLGGSIDKVKKKG